MDIVFLFNLMRGANGYDLLFVVLMFVMFYYFVCGEFNRG